MKKERVRSQHMEKKEEKKRNAFEESYLSFLNLVSPSHKLRQPKRQEHKERVYRSIEL